jgi:hypothetical protein
MFRTIFALSILCLISCQPPAEKNRYTPPKDLDPIQNYVVKEMEFDELWDKTLIEIGNIYKLSSKNKDSGEMSFIFTSEKVSEFIDCGMMNSEIYVDYIERIFESTLDGKIDIKLKSKDKYATKVSVVSEFRFISKETGTRWAFKTNKSKSILVGNPAYGADPYRDCQSKHFLEASILNRIATLK